MDVVKKNEVDKDDLVKNGGRQTDREIEREREKIKGIIMSKKIFYSIFSVVLFFLFANNVYGALCVENSGEIATPCEIGNTDVVDGGISTIKLKGISQFMTINEGGLLKNMVIASDTNEGIYILGQYGGVGGAGDDGSVYFGDSANHLSSLFIGDDLVSGGQGNGSLTLLNDAYIDAITITSDGVNPPSLLIIDASKTLNVKNITNSINSSITNKGIVSISAGASGQINKIVNNGTITNNAGGEFIINNYNVIENNATFDNHGIISINGNTSASFNIGSNGTLNMYNGSFINAVSGSFIENYGLINLIGGTINADVLNIYTNGKLVIEGSGSIAGKIHGACGGAGCGEIEIKMNYDMSAVTLGSVGNVIDKMAINNNAEVIIGNGSVNAVYINNIDVAHGGKLTSNGLLHGNVIVDGEYIMNYEAIGNIEVKNKGKAFIQALLTGDVIFSRSGADIPTATLEMGGFINGNISGDGTLILNRDYNSSDSGPPSYTTNFGLAGNTLNKLQIEDGKTFTLITGDSAYISHTDVKNNSLINVGGSLTGNINLLDATSVAKIINNGTIDGTAKGIGAVHIEYDYNDNVGTSFGSNLEHLSKLYINENLALSTNAHFTDSSEIKTGKTLTIENSGILNGNVYGDGKLILLNNGAGVKVGTSGSILSELEIGNGSANSAFTISENSNVTNTKIFSGSSLSVNGTGAANIAKLTGDVDTDGVYELGKFGEHYGKLNVGSGGNANLFGKLTGDMIIGGGGNAKIENDANSIVDGFIYGDGTLAIEKNYNVRETYFGKRTETQGGAVTIDWLNTLLIGDGTNSSNLVLNRDAAAQSANCYDASTGFCGASYVENIIINKNSSLEIDFSSGARIYGNVTGEGTLILNGNIVDIDDQSPNPNTLTFGGVANMIDTVRINGDLTFSDFGVTTNNFFKNIELVNNSIIKLGTQEGASDSYTATLTLYGKLKIANGSIFYINDEGILNLECLSGTQLCGSVEGIIFGNNVSGTGTININIDNFKLSTNKTTIGEANHVIDVVNIGDSVTSIHVEFDSNSQSAPENIHHINKVVISSGSSLTLSNKTDIKGTIVGSDLKIYKNYNDINTTFGASGDNIALLWVGAGGEKNNKLELKEVNKEAYITDLVVWGDNELFVSNTLNIGNQIHLKAGGKYVLEGKQDGKTLNEGGAIILKGEHIGDLLSRYDSVLDIKGGILNGDIVFEEGGANNIVNIYAGGLVKGAIYNCYWGCQQIVGGKVNILGDYIDTYTLFGDLSVGANGEYLDYLTIGDSNHNATLEIKTNDAYIAEEMKINSGSSLILNKNLTLGDSFINEGTYTVEISGSHIGYSNNNINKGLYILEGMHEGDVENYGTYHIKGFNGTQKNSNVINYGEFIVGDDTVTGSKGYLRGDNKIEQSGTTKLLGGGEINGMIYGDGVLDIGTQYISDSSVIPSPPTPGRVTTFGNVTEHLKNLVITGSKNGLELVNNSTHYIDLSTLNGQIGFLDVHDGATLHGDVTINYSGICASSYQYCNMYFLGFVINNVSTIGIQYGNVINDNSMTIVDDSKLYGDILLKTQGITLIDNRGVGKDSVSGFIYGAGKLELQRDYDDDITSFGKSNNYLGTLEIQDKDINDPDIYTTFTIKNGKDNYINNVIILDGQVFKIETNGVLDGGVTNNSYGCTSSLNCGGFVIEGTFHGNNLINNGARTYIYEGSEVVGNIYGNNSGDVFVGEGCDDGSEPSCYNGYKDSTSFGLSGNKL
ncbi:MAG: hypothetical protein LBC92_00320, partial [Rickettsiales bacterium]|nr:hypothetical protein [Rickettsiales bacterium]